MLFNSKAEFFQNSEKLKLAAIVFLCFSSILLLNAPNRYALVQADILPNTDFNELGKHWSVAGNAVRLTDGPKRTLLITNENSRQTLITQTLAAPQQFESIHVSFEMSLENVERGPEWWQQAGVILLGFDHNRARMKYWPHRIVLTSGSQPWAFYEAVIPVTEKMAKLQLFLFHGGQKGLIKLKNLRVNAMSERAWFTTIRTILIALWVIAGIWILVPPLLKRRKSLFAYLTFFTFVGMLVGALMPQPELSHIVRPVLSKWERILKPKPVADKAQAEHEKSKTGSAKKDQEAATSTDAGPKKSKNEATKTQMPKQTAQLPRAMDSNSREYAAHFFSHILLGFLVALVFNQTARWKLLGYLVIAAAIVELGQIFVITRSAGFGDGLANIAGAATGFVLYFIAHQTRSRFQAR